MSTRMRSVQTDEILVETLGGIKEVDLDVEGGEVRASTVDMGSSNF